MMPIPYTYPQEMPHHLTSKGQGAPQQDGMPRHDLPCRWTNGLGILHYLHPEGKWQAMSVLGSPWPQWGHLLWSPQDSHCGRSCSEFAHSCFFTKLDAHMDTGQSSWTRTPACLWLSTVPLEDTISCNFPLAWSVPKTSSRRKWIRSLKNAKDVLELQMTSPSMAALRQNMMLCTTSHADCLQIKLGVQLTENTHGGPSHQFFLAASTMPMVSIQTWER